MDITFTRFVISSNDIVLETDEGWASFARENEGPASIVPAPGMSLWELVKDPAARGLYRILLRAMRNRGNMRISYPFRCDSPNEKRFLRMVAETMEDKSVVFTSFATSIGKNTREGYENALQRRLELRICAVREAVFFDARWIDIVDAICGVEIFSRAPAIKLVLAECHTCPSGSSFPACAGRAP